MVQGIFTGNSIAGAAVHNDGTSQMKGRKYLFCLGISNSNLTSNLKTCFVENRYVKNDLTIPSSYIFEFGEKARKTRK